MTRAIPQTCLGVMGLLTFLTLPGCGDANANGPPVPYAEAGGIVCGQPNTAQDCRPHDGRKWFKASENKVTFITLAASEVQNDALLRTKLQNEYLLKTIGPAGLEECVDVASISSDPYISPHLRFDDISSSEVVVELEKDAKTKARDAIRAKIKPAAWAQLGTEFTSKLDELTSAKAQTTQSIRTYRLAFTNMGTRGITKKMTGFKPCKDKSVILAITGLLVTDRTTVEEVTNGSVVAKAFKATLELHAPEQLSALGISKDDASLTAEAEHEYETTMKTKISATTTSNNALFVPLWYLPDIVR